MPIRPYRPDSAIADDRPMPMTSRERVLAALVHEEPDRVPIVIGVDAPDAYLYDWPELGTTAIDEATVSAASDFVTLVTMETRVTITSDRSGPGGRRLAYAGPVVPPTTSGRTAHYLGPYYPQQ